MASKGGRMPESYEKGDLNFHYDREKRESMLSDETKRALKKTKLFTMNRRNMIILVDIGVILLFAMIFLPIVLGGKSNAKFDVFRAGLRAYEYDGRILVSLKVETRKENPDEAGLVSAVFSAEGTEASIEEVDLLPSSPDKARVLRAEFDPGEAEIGKVKVSVEIGGKKRNLSVGVKRE